MSKTPIEPRDIRKGDLIRFEYRGNDNAYEYRAKVAAEPVSSSADGQHYLLDRPTPEVELPTEPGWYLSRTGQLWVIKPGVPLHWTDDLPGIEVNPRNYAPFTRLEPVADTVKRVVDQILARGSIVAGLHVVERHHIKQVAKEFGVTDA